MKIVTISDHYLQKILKRWKTYPDHGIGLFYYFDNEFYFIPITSQSKQAHTDPIVKSRFYEFSCGGNLCIQNYIHCSPEFIQQVKDSKRIRNQLKEIKDNISKIEKSLIIQKANFKKCDTYKESFFKGYMKKIKENERAKLIPFALRFMDDAIKSMASLEKISFYEDKLSLKILENKIDVNDVEDIITIGKLKEAWKNLKQNLFIKELSLSYIIKLNEIVAVHQAAEVGTLRPTFGSVNGYSPVPVNEKIIQERLLKFKLKKPKQKINEAFEFFYSIIIQQWFYDGNKRTAFLVLNKLLIENEYGIILINCENQDEFDRLLLDCYNTYYAQPINVVKHNELKTRKKQAFFSFLKEKCLVELKSKTTS